MTSFARNDRGRQECNYTWVEIEPKPLGEYFRMMCQGLVMFGTQVFEKEEQFGIGRKLAQSPHPLCQASLWCWLGRMSKLRILSPSEVSRGVDVEWGVGGFMVLQGEYQVDRE